MIQRPPTAPRTDTPIPIATLVRALLVSSRGRSEPSPPAFLWPECAHSLSGHHASPFRAGDRRARETLRRLSHAQQWRSSMPDIIKDTRYLRTKEAAHYVGLSARTLEKHRTYGTGPA